MEDHQESTKLKIKGTEEIERNTEVLEGNI
ncbi:hypothetical protein LOK49_LG05G01303 [Camellia lanceoleosa]|uniref:Uncharacterized protein n=1 Tax=Camellia lanceoleosa TaxID=1840588 RepID=A0ACC0HU60_9ERIC|nr:hypothetical protein LOK49_LG05G01303 [Camellia lanceoleosa]